MREEFTLDVSYSQLAVFSSGLDDPFNSWTDSQVEQGYSWRQESTSFGTDDDGYHRIIVTIGSSLPDKHPAATRAIEVIFVSSKCNEVEIASIADSKLIPLKAGRYRLRFELSPSEPLPSIHLSFAPLMIAVT